MKAKHCAEQDYYLQIDGQTEEPTIEERQEFLCYDSQGGDINPHNPIFVAKSHYGMYVKDMRSSYCTVGWPGGAYLIGSTHPRLLREAFGDKAMQRWS